MSPSKTTVKTKRNKKRLTKQQLTEIASSDGFSKYIGQAQGYGKPALFTNGKNIRAYNIFTGKMIYEHHSRTLAVSPRFHAPEEHVPISPDPIQNTGYAKLTRINYSKRGG